VALTVLGCIEDNTCGGKRIRRNVSHTPVLSILLIPVDKVLVFVVLEDSAYGIVPGYTYSILQILIIRTIESIRTEGKLEVL
jgi:hypothetical protein